MHNYIGKYDCQNLFWGVYAYIHSCVTGDELLLCHDFDGISIKVAIAYRERQPGNCPHPANKQMQLITSVHQWVFILFVNQWDLFYSPNERFRYCGKWCSSTGATWFEFAIPPISTMWAIHRCSSHMANQNELHAGSRREICVSVYG